MQTVSSPFSFVHSDSGITCPGMIRGGHLDEGSALLADAEYEPTPAEWDEVAALVADQALSDADSHVRDMLGELRTDALAEMGNVRCRVDRSVILDGTGEFRVQWMVSIGNVAAGIGATPDEALADCLRCVDAAKGITPIPTGGYRVAGLASVLGAPYRSDAEALQHARRMAVKPEYLDAALIWQCPGTTDDRQPATTIAVA
jgi:hypothetical protein